MTQDVHTPDVASDNNTNVVAISPAVAEMIERAHSGVAEAMDWRRVIELET